MGRKVTDMKVFLLICLAVVGSSGLESISKGQGSRIDPQNGANEVRLRVKINEKAEGKDREESWNLATIPWDTTTIPWCRPVGSRFYCPSRRSPPCPRCCYPYCTCVPKPWDDKHQKRENNKNQDEMKYQQST